MIAWCLALIFLFSSKAIAKNAEPTGEWLQAKTIAENIYKESLQQSIATQLDSSQFKINVYLNISKLPENTASVPSNNTGNFMPSLRGLVDAESIMESYNGKLKALQLEQNSKTTDYLKKYRIDSAQISLGLKKGVYSADYQQQLKTWLIKRTRVDLGVPVQVEVSAILDRVENNEETNKKLSEWFKEFENLIGAVVFSLTALIVAAIWFIQRYLSLQHDKNVNELNLNRAAMAGLEENKSTEQAPPVVEKKETSIMGPMDSENLAATRFKLAKVFDSLQSDRETFVSRLASGSPDDRLKASLLIDAWLHFWVENHGNSEKDLNWMIYMKGIEPFKFQLLETIEELKTLPEEKIKSLIKEAYWDLLGFRTVGGKFISKPLSFLKSLEIRELLQIFNKQNLKTQAFLFMHLTQEQKEHVKNSMDSSRFDELLKKQIEVVILKPSEIDQMHEEIRSTYDLISNGRVNLIGRLPEVLSVLTTEEENSFIAENRSKFIELGFDLRKLSQSVSTWPEWKEEPKKILLQALNVEEIVVFIGMFSAYQDQILGYCSDFTKNMVLQDLNESKFSVSEQEKQTIINSINSKLKELIAKKEINYENIFQEEGRLYADKIAS